MCAWHWTCIYLYHTAFSTSGQLNPFSESWQLCGTLKIHKLDRGSICCNVWVSWMCYGLIFTWSLGFVSPSSTYCYDLMTASDAVSNVALLLVASTFRAEKTALNHWYSLYGWEGKNPIMSLGCCLSFLFVGDKEAGGTLHTQFMCESALS